MRRVRNTAILLAAVMFSLMSISPHAHADILPEPQDENSPPETFDEAVVRAKTTMVGAPHKALEFARAAERLAKNAELKEARETSLWLQSEALTRLNRPDEARPLIERAIALLDDHTTKLGGDLLLARGRIERMSGDEGKALEAFQAAYLIFVNRDEKRGQAIALQSIGTLYDSAHQYERVIEYYERASTVFSDGAILDLVSLNNRANAYRELERYDEARQMLSKSLAMAEESSSPLLQARILTNIAVLEVRRGNFDAAEKAIEQGLALAKADEAKGWRPFLWGARAQLEFARNDLAASRTQR